MAVRSVIISNERRVMAVNELLDANELALKERHARLTKLYHKHKQNIFLRLRRSCLGSQIFGKSQRKILKLAFGAWFDFWRHHTMSRQSFDMKQKLIKLEVDLGRVNKDILQS